MSQAGKRYLGIDFSGNAESWRAGKAQNVWLAEVTSTADAYCLSKLMSVQQLGAGNPFQLLVQRLQCRDFATAAIDAPFSVPASFLPSGTHAGLLDRVAGIPVERGRPFCRGGQLVRDLAPQLPDRGHKIFRATERAWSVTTRSTMWNGPRGGAPFAAASLTLLARSKMQCWPWAKSSEGLLVEAFPAAQLRIWKLPHQKYAGQTPEQIINRHQIVDHVVKRVQCSAADIAQIRQNPDALDAVLCCFAGIAVKEGRLAKSCSDGGNGEGWIAVHA